MPIPEENFLASSSISSGRRGRFRPLTALSTASRVPVFRLIGEYPDSFTESRPGFELSILRALIPSTPKQCRSQLNGIDSHCSNFTQGTRARVESVLCLQPDQPPRTQSVLGGEIFSVHHADFIHLSQPLLHLSYLRVEQRPEYPSPF